MIFVPTLLAVFFLFYWMAKARATRNIKQLEQWENFPPRAPLKPEAHEPSQLPEDTPLKEVPIPDEAALTFQELLNQAQSDLSKLPETFAPSEVNIIIRLDKDGDEGPLPPVIQAVCPNNIRGRQEVSVALQSLSRRFQTPKEGTATIEIQVGGNVPPTVYYSRRWRAQIKPSQSSVRLLSSEHMNF